MIRIGEYQTLRINRQMPQGFYLIDDEDESEVLLPNAFITEDMQLEDMLKVFVYCDASDREVATTEKPLLSVGNFAYLDFPDVNDTGAFADLGIQKQLFVPYSNQAHKINAGEKHVVYMYLDEITDRLVGTTKLGGYLDPHADEDIQKGQEVNCLIYQETDLGYKAVVDQYYAGLFYKNEVPQKLSPGQLLRAYVKPLRPDKKIDLSLSPIGHESIGPNADKILRKLEAAEGFLPFTDKSAPEAIRQEFGISKKLFKKALGALYKQKKVLLKPDGIYKA